MIISAKLDLNFGVSVLDITYLNENRGNKKVILNFYKRVLCLQSKMTRKAIRTVKVISLIVTDTILH